MNKGILYIVFVEILSIYLENFKDEAIFELIEEIDNQGIKSNIDKSGKLTNIGKQNLKFAVEKYQNSFFAGNEFASNPSLIEEAPKDNKIAVINDQIKGVQNDMKNNVKNMITNIIFIPHRIPLFSFFFPKQALLSIIIRIQPQLLIKIAIRILTSIISHLIMRLLMRMDTKHAMLIISKLLFYLLNLLFNFYIVIIFC